MSNQINIAIIGLGQVGSEFFKKFAEKKSNGINIIAAVDSSSDAPGVQVAKDNNVEVFTDFKDVIAKGDDVDVIIDVTGNEEVKKEIRRELARAGNEHTVVAPEVIAFMLWGVMGEGLDFGGHTINKGY